MGGGGGGRGEGVYIGEVEGNNPHVSIVSTTLGIQAHQLSIDGNHSDKRQILFPVQWQAE